MLLLCNFLRFHGRDHGLCRFSYRRPMVLRGAMGDRKDESKAHALAAAEATIGRCVPFRSPIAVTPPYSTSALVTARNAAPSLL